MTIKLAKELKGTPAGSVVECDETEGKALVADGSAELHDATAERTKAIQAAAEQAVKAQEKSMSVEIVKSEDQFIIGKAIQALAVRDGKIKSVTGMSEGTAADGGALLATAVTEIQGLAMTGSVIYPKCIKVRLAPGFNAAKIPIDDSDGILRANAPVITSPAEGNQKTSTKLQFSPATVSLVKSVMYVPLVDELLQDIPSLDGYVRNWMVGKLAADFDAQALAGTVATTGILGVTDATASAFYTSKTVSATPTLAELMAMIAAVHPALRKGSEWYIANSIWQAIVSALATSANIQAMLIDPRVGAEKLIGLPVNIAPGLAAAHGVVLGNFGAYAVVEPTVNDIIAKSTDVRFEYDETVIRIVRRIGGTPAFAKRTLADSTTVGAFVIKT